VNKAEPLQGDTVKIKGSVKPAGPGARVVLQRRYAGQKAWKTVDSRLLSRASNFTFKDKVTTVRTRTYRVVKPAGPHRAAGHSKPLKVTVFGWRDLTSLSPATQSGFNEYATGVKMNGVAYPNSLRAYPSYPPGSPSTIDYNLDRGCKSFRGVVGLDDSSQATGTAQVSLYTDGRQRWTGAFALTETAPVAFDVTNVFRLTVGAALVNGLAAVGTPQVLCSL
jgi:putative transposon-encoded protein